MTTALRESPGPIGDGLDEEVLLRASDVALLLQVSVKRVYELPIKRVRISRRSVRWRSADLREFVERRIEEG